MNRHPALPWLAAAYLLGLLPLLDKLSLWLLLPAGAAILARLLMALDSLKPLASPWPGLLALVCALPLALQARGQGLLGALLGLLVLGCAFKFLEFRHRRDLGFHALALFFMGGLTLLYHTGPLMGGYLLLLCLLGLGALLSLYRVAPWPQQGRLALLLLVQSLPLMLLLFVLLPRLGPLWKMPDPRVASTGLSESVAPGAFSQLTRDSRLVLRVHFDGPPPAQRYWRVWVHEIFDGQAWQRRAEHKNWQAQLARLPDTPRPPAQGPGYDLLLEPGIHQQLPVLWPATSQAPDLRLSPWGGWALQQAVTQPRQIRFSGASLPPPSLSETERRLNLALPPGNPRSRALVASWRRQAVDDGGLVQVAMAYFRQAPFAYTLSPPPLSGDQVDAFVFDSRRGFCAHYASALAFLLRAAGIPARLVTGYLGGEYQADAGYLSLYQFDAHAWVEAWWDGRWHRLDPTAMVAPERVEQGLDQLVGADEFLAADPFSLQRYRQVPLLNELRLWLAELDYRWTLWVVNYDGSRQQRLLSWLGSEALWARAAWLLGGGLLLAALVSLGLWWGRRPVPEALAVRLYRRACRTLTRRGVGPTPGETPQAYAQRLTQIARPEAEVMTEIAALLGQLRYAKTTKPGTLARLRRLVRRL